MESTPRENFIRVMQGERTEWYGNPWDCFHTSLEGRPFTPDAITVYLGKPEKGSLGFVDKWGVTWDFPDNQPGPIPNTTPENKVIKDVARWRDYINFPSIKNLPWADFKSAANSLDRENKLVLCCSVRGMFEFSHAVMGFEDALVNYLLEPDCMFELLDAYADWKIACAEALIDEMQPDFIMNQDDWGSRTKLFLSPSVWRDIIKPTYKKYYGYIKSRGIMIMHHCDCYAQDLARDMVDLGIDVWQGVIAENDIQAVVEQTEGKLLLLGGIDMSVIDFDDAPEELIRAHIRSVIDSYAPLGSFLPCYTSIRPVHDRVMEISNDEMARHGAVFAKKRG